MLYSAMCLLAYFIFFIFACQYNIQIWTHHSSFEYLKLGFSISEKLVLLSYCPLSIVSFSVSWKINYGKTKRSKKLTLFYTLIIKVTQTLHFEKYTFKFLRVILNEDKN